MTLAEIAATNISRIMTWREAGVSWAAVAQRLSTETGDTISEGSLKAAFSRATKASQPHVQIEKVVKAEEVETVENEEVEEADEAVSTVVETTVETADSAYWMAPALSSSTDLIKKLRSVTLRNFQSSADKIDVDLFSPTEAAAEAEARVMAHFKLNRRGLFDDIVKDLIELDKVGWEMLRADGRGYFSVILKVDKALDRKAA
jgi:hypothetical protein